MRHECREPRVQGDWRRASEQGAGEGGGVFEGERLVGMDGSRDGGGVLGLERVRRRAARAVPRGVARIRGASGGAKGAEEPVEAAPRRRAQTRSVSGCLSFLARFLCATSPSAYV